MIALIDGKIGAGKTYLAVSRIVAQLAAGGEVATNIELSDEGLAKVLKQRYGLEYRPEAIKRLTEADAYAPQSLAKSGTEKEPYLIVLDEIHLWFSARDFQRTADVHRQTMAWLSQSRKLGMDVVMISQSEKNIDVQMRRLAQETWRVRNLGQLKLPLLGIGYPFQHSLLFRIDNVSGGLIERKLIKRNKLIYDAYDTRALLRPVNFSGEVSERIALKQVRKESSWLDKAQKEIWWAAKYAALIYTGFFARIFGEALLKWLNWI